MGGATAAARRKGGSLSLGSRDRCAHERSFERGAARAPRARPRESLAARAARTGPNAAAKTARAARSGRRGRGRVWRRRPKNRGSLSAPLAPPSRLHPNPIRRVRPHTRARQTRRALFAPAARPIRRARSTPGGGGGKPLCCCCCCCCFALRPRLDAPPGRRAATDRQESTALGDSPRSGARTWSGRARVEDAGVFARIRARRAATAFKRARLMMVRSPRSIAAARGRKRGREDLRTSLMPQKKREREGPQRRARLLSDRRARRRRRSAVAARPPPPLARSVGCSFFAHTRCSFSSSHDETTCQKKRGWWRDRGGGLV